MNRKLGSFLAACALAAVPAGAQLQVNGYLSFQYQKGESASAVHQGEFDNARAGLFFSGLIERVFDYNLEVRYDSPDLFSLQEAWVGYRPSDSFHLKVGLYLVPFGTYNTASRPYQTPLIQPPLAQAALFPESWRDLGGLVEGKFGMFKYDIYLGNGLREGLDLSAGQQFGDNNTNKAVGGRLSLNLSRGFDVGGSYYRGKFDDPGQRNLTLYALHAGWVTEGFRILYEYDNARIANPAGFAKGEAKGHLVLATLTWGRLSPVVSYQKLDYSDPFHGTGFSPAAGLLGTPGAGIAAADSRWTVGAMYAPVDAVMIKVEYDINREKAAEIKNNVFLAQVALHF